MNSLIEKFLQTRYRQLILFLLRDYDMASKIFCMQIEIFLFLQGGDQRYSVTNDKKKTLKLITINQSIVVDNKQCYALSFGTLCIFLCFSFFKQILSL